MNVVRAIMPGVGLVRAEGTVVSRGKRIGLAEGRITGPDGRLYAHGTSSCLIFPLKMNGDG